MANKKLSREWIESQILSEEYIVRGERFMVCILYTKGGYYVTGESAPINPAEFSDELGRKYSREEGVSKIWRIEGIIHRKKHFAEEPEPLLGEDGHQPLHEDEVEERLGSEAWTQHQLHNGE